MTEAAMSELMSRFPENPVKSRFKEYAIQIDQVNDRHERLVKASRDVTIQSKKVIFQLHRIGTGNKFDVLKQAEASLSRVRQIIVKRIIPELNSDDFLRFHRAYSPGLQEYIEARTFLSYCESDAHIITPDELNAELQKDLTNQLESATEKLETTTTFNLIGLTDYVLGIADLTGEMMRRAVATKSRQDAVTIFDRLLEIEYGIDALVDARVYISKDFGQKVKVLKQSIGKVQKSCFDRVVQEAEQIDMKPSVSMPCSNSSGIPVPAIDEDGRKLKKYKSEEEPSQAT